MPTESCLRSRAVRISSEGGLVAMAQVAALAGSLGLLKVVTGHLSPEEYGRLALALTLAGLVTQVGLGGLCSATSRFYSIAVERRDLDGYAEASRMLFRRASLAIGTGSVIASLVVLVLVGVEWWHIFLATASFALVSGYSSAAGGILTAARRRSLVAALSSADSLIRVGLVVASLAVLGPSCTGILLAFATSSLIGFCLQWRAAKQLLYRAETSPISMGSGWWMSRMWVFAWPLLAAGVFNWAYLASQRWSLELFVSTAEVGKFYALTQVAAAPVAVAGTILMTLIQPVLFSRVGDPSLGDGPHRVRLLIVRLVRAGVFLTACVVLSCALFHEQICSLLLPPSFSDLSPLLPVVVAAAATYQISLVLASYVTAANQTRATLLKDVVGNSLIALGNLSLTFLYGTEGLVIGMLLGAVVHLYWNYVIVKRLSQPGLRGQSATRRPD